MKPKFKQNEDGLVIVDPIERKRYPLETETPVTPTAGDKNRIPYPMDSAAEITTEKITLPENPHIYVRNSRGTFLTEVTEGSETSLPRNEYLIDISSSLKIYIYIDDAVRIRVGAARAELSFEKPTQITISARSHHRRPAETITTTADPRHVMQAVSMFGSALQTTTPLRSYPTLRGHPPSLKRGNELTVPDGLNRPQTGIRIELPPTLRHVFIVATLAYYLGAKIVPGSIPQLVTETGYTYPLDGKDGFETAVERVLKQIFFLDCIVQTEGETPSPLYERQAVEPVLECDIEDLYGQSLVEQIETYLELPYESIEPQVPTWYSEARLEPTTDSIEFLPFITNDLSCIKIRDESNAPTPQGQLRTDGESRKTDVSLQSTQSESESVCRADPVIQQRWKNSDGTDIASTKPLSAFRNTITRSPRDGPLRIAVICNDPNMTDEFVTVHSTYRERSDIPFNVTVYHDLSKNELRNVLAKESDFLHYIGHIDTDGFRCSDGTLDAAGLESVGTKAFFLNACRSYKQGLHLIEAGSTGGIVTKTEIQNRTAVDAGSTIARLLNTGMPLYAALRIYQRTVNTELQYHVLGEGDLILSHMEVGPPVFVKMKENKSRYDVKLVSYTNSEFKPGSVYIPYLSAADSYRLVPGEATFTSVSKPDIVEFLNKEKCPVLLQGELRWSTEIKTSEL